MAKKNVSGAICVVFVVAIACIAWSQGVPIGPPPSPGGYYQPSQAPSPPATGQSQPGWAPPPPAYRSQQEMAAPQTSQPHPSYPYPSHHNPYYDGVPHSTFLSQWFDYMFNLPGAVIGRVGDLMDRTVFPASPATHGKPSGGPAPEAPGPPVHQPPLPPASVYDQTKR